MTSPTLMKIPFHLSQCAPEVLSLHITLMEKLHIGPRLAFRQNPAPTYFHMLN